MKIRVLLTLIWLVNGLICKVLGLVPRHEAIVERILGDQFAHILTPLIGLSECVMAAWILSGRWPRLCAWCQIGLVLTMNVLEGILATDLLLWGQWNALWAVLFCLFVWFTQLRTTSKAP